jgi:hypothetical protein
MGLHAFDFDLPAITNQDDAEGMLGSQSFHQIIGRKTTIVASFLANRCFLKIDRSLVDRRRLIQPDFSLPGNYERGKARRRCCELSPNGEVTRLLIAIVIGDGLKTPAPRRSKRRSVRKT